jgi:hypothetical protein
MDVSIIVVNYNSLDYTKTCIKSIIQNTSGIEYEIILIDNASEEFPAEELLNELGNIIIIRNERNDGFGKANNQGMEIATGEYYLLLNNDTILLNDSISIAYNYAIARKRKYQVFGATLYNADGSEQNSYYLKKGVGPLSALLAGLVSENILLNRVINISKESKTEIGGLYGAYIFLHRKVFQQLGGFDEDFFMYCEDIEWFRNRINKQYKIDICKQAKIKHFGGMSGEKTLVVPNNVLSYYLYWYKLGYYSYFLYTISSILTCLFNLFLTPFLSSQERARHFRLIQIRILCI